MPRKPNQQRRLYDKCKDPTHFNAKPELARLYWEQYQKGLSLAQIASLYGKTRTGVHNLLKSHGYQLRSKKILPFILFNGDKYTRKPSGYYAKTNGKRTLLHRDIWEFYKGNIPEGHDIHHVDENKENNRIENLKCMPKAQHSREHYSLHANQFKKGNIPHNARKKIKNS